MRKTVAILLAAALALNFAGCTRREIQDTEESYVSSPAFMTVAAEKEYVPEYELITEAAPVSDTVLREDGTVEIFTAEGLPVMAEDPFGHYVLGADIDMTGVSWKPFEFRGEIDGSGHSIYNLRLDELGDERFTSVDGNLKEYDTRGAGLFSVTRGAKIHDLGLINVRGKLVSDENCFIAPFAGGAFDTEFRNLTVTGELELVSKAAIAGVSGITGFGIADCDGCRVDMTLIHEDTLYDAHCESFLAGVLGCGRGTMDDCSVELRGYDSCFGYVHDGGVIGLYIQYDREGGWVTEHNKGNDIRGFIRFFEKNPDRRAYCEPYAGETLRWTGDFLDFSNHQSFLRDEVFTYDTVLRPHNDCGGELRCETLAPTCTEVGFTLYTCPDCGYSYTDDYTLPHHTEGEWVTETEATNEEPGTELMHCTVCGEILGERRVLPALRTTGLWLNYESIALEKNGAATITAVIAPENARNQELIWMSEDPSIVSVDDHGNVRGLKTGTTAIHCTPADGGAESVCCVVSVGRGGETVAAAMPAPIETPKQTPMHEPAPVPAPEPTPMPPAKQLFINTYRNGVIINNTVSDNSYDTWYSIEGDGEFTVETADGSCFSALYLGFGARPDGFVAVYPDGTEDRVENGMLHQTYHLKKPSEKLTILILNGNDLRLAEVSAYTDGALPADVQDWQQMGEGEADLLLFPAHADDEYVMFGGLIPYYAKELGLKVQVCWMICHDGKYYRNHELLNALWTVGCRYYPEINFPADDFRCWHLDNALQHWGMDMFESYQVEMLRKYKPYVAVSHDTDGESSHHGAHCLASAALQLSCFDAADPTKYPESAVKYGTWQVPKTYLHLYGDDYTVIDDTMQLESFNGLSIYEAALQGFLKHTSQVVLREYTVFTAGHPNDSRLWGLYYSTVGEDVRKDDLFENIDLSANKQSLGSRG